MRLARFASADDTGSPFDACRGVFIDPSIIVLREARIVQCEKKNYEGVFISIAISEAA